MTKCRCKQPVLLVILQPKQKLSRSIYNSWDCNWQVFSCKRHGPKYNGHSMRCVRVYVCRDTVPSSKYKCCLVQILTSKVFELWHVKGKLDTTGQLRCKFVSSYMCLNAINVFIDSSRNRMSESRRQASKERSLTERARECKELENVISRLEKKLRNNEREHTRLQRLISSKKVELRRKRELYCHPRTKVREYNVASLMLMHGCHVFCCLCGNYIVQGAYKGESALSKGKSQTAVSNMPFHSCDARQYLLLLWLLVHAGCT